MLYARDRRWMLRAEVGKPVRERELVTYGVRGAAR